ncbi:MAG: autotransporter domain-containing protein [Cetobacterium sp.]|uniref:autotransporter domain-containing protein n=1 Tax=Cetobacterium sp. TaxID=2071632 RepID=UPI002FCAE790
MIKFQYSLFIIFSVLIAENIQAEEIKEYKKELNVKDSINYTKSLDMSLYLDPPIDPDFTIAPTGTPPIIDPPIDPDFTIAPTGTPPITDPPIPPINPPVEPPVNPNPPEQVIVKQILEAPQKYTVHLMNDSLNQYNEMLNKNYDYPNINNWEINSSLLGSSNEYNGYGNKLKSIGVFLNGEYGITKTNTLGIAFQGTNQDLDFENQDKLKGSNFIFGVFNRNKYNKYEINTGINYQFGEYKANRYEKEIQNKSLYNSNSISATAIIKREILLSNNLFLIPKLGARYTYFFQEKIEENNNITGIEFNSKQYNIFNTEIGLGLKKIVYLQNGILEFEPNLSYTYSKNNMYKQLEGNRIFENENIFINKLENEKHIGKVSFDVHYKKSNNLFINSGISYSNSDVKNRDINIYLGFGYKFNNFEDLSLFNKEKIEKTFILDTRTGFDFNESYLNSENKEKIEKISQDINNVNGDVLIKVIGHTDNIGSRKYNKKLSEKRAQSVVDEFKKNIIKENINYNFQGNGFDTPISTNETDIGRALNRRVEINIIEDLKNIK